MGDRLTAIQSGRPKLTAHRGGKAYAPENTMAAFEKALEMGADLIEIDLRLSADGHVVVIHDSRVDRTTDGTGWVGEKTLDELRSLDAGSWFAPEYAGQTIPTFEEVVAWAKGRIGLNIELKYGPDPFWYPEMAEKVVAILREYDVLDEVFVHSFNHTAVHAVKTMEPRLLTAINFHCIVVNPVGLARESGADILNMHKNFLTVDLVQFLHKNGLGVQCFTNKAKDAAALVEMGVDYIDSDYVDMLQRAVDSIRGEIGPS